jgi:transcriptional regulator GlxA family with amidase domain
MREGARDLAEDEHRAALHELSLEDRRLSFSLFGFVRGVFLGHAPIVRAAAAPAMSAALAGIPARLEMRSRSDHAGCGPRLRVEIASQERMSSMRTATLPVSPLVPANDVSVDARDPRIARALEAMARAPEQAWTVARLAKVAALSRAAFARRFLAEVGAPPLKHLAALRMQLAAGLLVNSERSLAEIAELVGYANEFALSRAFHRSLGARPGTFRRQARSTSTFAPRCLAA